MGNKSSVTSELQRDKMSAENVIQVNALELEQEEDTRQQQDSCMNSNANDNNNILPDSDGSRLSLNEDDNSDGFSCHQPTYLDHIREKIDIKKMDPEKKDKVKAGLFLATVSGLSILSGFGTSIAFAKRQDPNNFSKGLSGSREIPESALSFASRALARGTLVAVTGVGLICFTIWKMLGVHDLKEFRYKVGTLMPKVPKSENPGRGDFKTIRDLFQFIIDEDEKEKKEKESNSTNKT